MRDISKLSPLKYELEDIKNHLTLKMGFSDDFTARTRGRPKNYSTDSIVERTRNRNRDNSNIGYSVKKIKIQLKSETESSSDEEFKGKFECNICDEIFDLQRKRDYHWRSHVPTFFPDGPGKPGHYECEQCEMTFPKRFRLGRHRKAHQMNIHKYLPKNIRCILCYKKFRTENALFEHIEESITDHEPVQCDICKNIYRSKKKLIIHIKKKHAVPLICHICGCEKSNIYSMKMHVQRHEKNYEVFCDICNKGFYNNCEVRNHKFYSHTDKDTNRPFVCQYCGRTYRSNNYLKIHTKIAHVEAEEYKRKRYKCDLCNFDTHLLKCLTLHKQTHTGENLIPCLYCKKLINKRSMKNHIRLHTGEKPFNCSICGKDYNSKKNLVRHYNTNHKPKI